MAASEVLMWQLRRPRRGQLRGLRWSGADDVRDREPGTLDTGAMAVEGSRTGVAKVDTVVTVVFLVGHGALTFLSLMVTPAIGMSTDPCSYQECGNEAWILFALVLAAPVSLVVFLIVLVVSTVKMGRQRRASFVPLIGCIAQVALLLGAFMMVWAAGPTTE